MLLLCRLRNREWPGSKEIPFLPEGSLPWPCALEGLALASSWGKESGWPMGRAHLEPEPFHPRPCFEYLGFQNFLPRWP